MPPRAVWKGALKIGELACPVSLYTAVSTADRIAFHTLNRETHNRVQRQFVDTETGVVVSPADQVKGYEIETGAYVVLEPEEIASAIPESDKTLQVESFVTCGAVDTVYLDRPYFVQPSDTVGVGAFAVVRDGLRSRKVAALARAVLFRRMRTVLIQPHDDGLLANLLNFDYEIRSSASAFETIPPLSLKGEMIDLAKHIIKTKMGQFDPKSFHDRYEDALAETVRAKMEGRSIAPRPQRAAPAPIDLLQALRESAGAAKPSRAKKPTAKRLATAKDGKAAPRRKAG